MQKIWFGNIGNVYEFEIPQLVLTCKANLEVENGKGGVDLDWSTYDKKDKYFVIYRKEKNAENWEKIVDLEKKLTENKYTDIFANDKEVPNAPSINISGSLEENNININLTSLDNGTKYSYYVEAYDSANTDLLISVSN